MNSSLTTLPWLTVNANSVSDYPDAINQIYKCEFGGMLIKQVFSLNGIVEVKHQVELRKDALVPESYGGTLGTNIVANGNDRSQYFKDTVAFRHELRHIFPTGYEKTIEVVLSQMSGGRTVKLLEEDMNAYTPVKIRFVHPKTQGITVHRANQFISLAGFDYLQKTVKLEDSVALVIMIEEAERGGELVVYDPLPGQSTSDPSDFHPENYEKRFFKPQIGDMVLFQAGCVWHQVASVRGAKSRISAGTKLTISKDDQKIFYWI